MNQSKSQTLPWRVPRVVFKTRIPNSQGGAAENVCEDGAHLWQDRTSEEIFGGKKVVLFALPGAFTPTCSSTHLPGYEKHFNEFRQYGIDEVICLSVNDAFTMNSWGKELGVKNVMLLADGNTDFTKGMDMLVKKEDLGFGDRSWRYSMYVEDGAIKKIFVEPGYMDNCLYDPFEVSDAKTMLVYLKEKADTNILIKGEAAAT